MTASQAVVLRPPSPFRFYAGAFIAGCVITVLAYAGFWGWLWGTALPYLIYLANSIELSVFAACALCAVMAVMGVFLPVFHSAMRAGCLPAPLQWTVVWVFMGCALAFALPSVVWGRWWFGGAFLVAGLWCLGCVLVPRDVPAVPASPPPRIPKLDGLPLTSAPPEDITAIDADEISPLVVRSSVPVPAPARAGRAGKPARVASAKRAVSLAGA